MQCNRWRIITIGFFLILLPILTATAANQKQPIVCKQLYALCSAAKCIPEPDKPGKAICYCQNYNGLSVGDSSCEKRKPYTNSHGIKFIVSTFSFMNKQDAIMTCPAGTLWTNCLDEPCTVDPTNPSKSICSCKIVKAKQAIVTFGGGCDTSTCKNSYWSGADPTANTALQTTLAKRLRFNIKTGVKICKS